jgi:hypothetical protein
VESWFWRQAVLSPVGLTASLKRRKEGDMSDLFFFRDALEPEGAPDALQSRPGGGAGESTADEFVGYSVEATDGKVGKVLDVDRAPGASYLIVSTGGTILSKRVLIPAGTIERVDRDGKALRLDRSTEEIKNAPEFDEERYREDFYRQQLTEHYAR